MTGMWNFKLCLCFISLASIATGAEVSLVGDNKITGELLAMDADGNISISTPYADQSLQLNADKIIKIEFEKSDQKIDIPQQNLTLINGDSIPVEVRGMNNKVLQISSPILGELDIPREFIDSLDIGDFAKKSIYSGPKEISEWSNASDEVTNWDVRDGSLASGGYGVIYRDVKLPENYAVRFKAGWDTDPNFRFYLCDSMDYSGKSANRYYLLFTKAGFELIRESTGRSRYNRIAAIKRLPDEFTTKEVSIEVRVKRKEARLDFYINDQLQGTYQDPHPNIPSGTGIAISSYMNADNKLRISNLEITEWENRGDKHRLEDRGDGKEDAVIGRNGERFGGSLISISAGKSGKVYRFKSNFQTDLLDIPDSEISCVYFSKLTAAKPEEFNGMRLFFKGRGAIQVSKCVFNDNTLSITHPLLGDLQLNRPSVSRLERHMMINSNPSKEE